MKLPAFQFYPADWRKDPGIQALSRHDRSVWFDILCIMHESEERGVLLLAGKPIPDDALARMLNLDNQTCNQTVSTLLTYGVASRRDSDGAIYSRRMVRDEELIKIRREAGKKGGNPLLLNQNNKQTATTHVKQKPTPSSSSSFSSSDNIPPNPQGGDADQHDDDHSQKRVLPSDWKKLTKTEQKQTRVQRNSKLMIRIGSWFGRKPETLWMVDEAVSLMRLQPTEEEIQTVESYYTAIIPKDDDFRRKNIPTLLNNWAGEHDRAKVWMSENDMTS